MNLLSLILGCTATFISTITSQAQTDTLLSKTLTPAQLREDFSAFRKLHEQAHPGLYRYNDRAVMQHKFDSTEALLHGPLGFYAFHKMLSALSADIRCAHTYIIPTQSFNKHTLEVIKTLPFYLYPVEDKQLVIFNGTLDQTIKPGFELTHINHQSVDSIVRVIRKHYWSDGYNKVAKNKALEGMVFAFFYYVLIDQPEEFHLSLIDLDGKDITINVTAQHFKVSNSNFLRNPVNNQMMSYYNKGRKDPWVLTFPEDMPSTALLQISSFGGSGIDSEEEAQKKFRKFMDKSLKEISKKKSTALIIDLRNNSGGWDVMGSELATYLMQPDQRIRYYRKLLFVADDRELLSRHSDLSEAEIKEVSQLTRENGIISLTEKESSGLNELQAKPQRFEGKAYVLINEMTSSAGAEFAAIAKSNRLCTLIGAETNGAYGGGNSGSFVRYKLPHSKMFMQIPLVKYELAVEELQPVSRGTLPDYAVHRTVGDIMQGRDAEMELAKELISKED